MEERRNKPYKGKTWKTVRAMVMKYDKGLCQRCLGKYMPDITMPVKRTKAVLVHHHFPVTNYPEYKYQMFVKKSDGTRIRNLYSLCTECHEFVHKDTHRNKQQKKAKLYRDDSFTTPERWD